VLEQQTELHPTEIMTDTGAYTDVVFGLFWLLGYRFCPRIADIGGGPLLASRRLRRLRPGEWRCPSSDQLLQVKSWRILSQLFGVPAATVQKFTLRNVFLASLEYFSGQNWPKHRILREIPA
jgi:hypothetical protein